MDGLRVSLILLGIAVIAGVIIWDRYRRNRANREQWNDLPDPAERLDEGGSRLVDEPEIDDWEVIPIPPKSAVELNEKIVASRDEVTVEENASNSETTEPEESIVVLSVMATGGKQFDGTAIFNAVSTAGLVFGEHDIFHAYPVSGNDEPLFSLANVLEPGSFNRNNMESVKTPGLALFMRLPGPQSGDDALASLLSAAEQITTQLGGELCDERRQPLTDEKRASLRQQATVYVAQC